MKYTSTRSITKRSSAEAILEGLAHDGGLYVPQSIPKLDLKDCQNLTYQEIAIKVLSLFFTDFDDTEIIEIVGKSYNDENFDHPSITHIRDIKEDQKLLELFYGKTSAFKDQALSIYPYLLKLAMKNKGIKHLTILTATSGDTGKAAMEAISDVEGLSIAVLYPEIGTSYIQAHQMKTQKGNNILPLAIQGNFDDAQSAVKDFFMKHKDLSITSANSINIARLLPQVIYYYDLFARLPKSNKLVDVYVPTGNFGNILAAYIAKQMGLPIHDLYVCTNDNNVLYEFFQTGVYDIREKEFKITVSPSMDILISSNLERLLYFIFKDTHKINQWMHELKETQKFELNEFELELLQKEFKTQMTSNQDTFKTVQSVFNNKGILLDPHTATAIPQNESDNIQIIVSTASPYKFPNIYKELFELETDDVYQILSEIELRSHEPYPQKIRDLEHLDPRFNQVVAKEDIEATLHAFIKKETRHEI